MQLLHEMPKPTLHRYSIRHLNGVGTVLAQRLHKLGILNIFDLLLHFPMRYEDRSTFTPFAQLTPNMTFLVVGKIMQCWQPPGKKKQCLLRLQDEHGYVLQVRFFQCPYSLLQRLQQATGQLLSCYGMVRWVGKQLEMIHPEIRFFATREEVTASPYLVPIYPTTDKLTQNVLRKLIHHAINWMQTHSNKDHFTKFLDTHFPAQQWIDQKQWMNFFEAVNALHFPLASVEPMTLINPHHPARMRLALEELIVHSLMSRMARQQIQHSCAPIIEEAKDILIKFQSCLPYQLTQAQLRVIDEIANDLMKTMPMYRLVQGDVGTGKTVVAAAAAMQMIANGLQVALMAPTEILAKQHFFQFKQWVVNLWGEEKKVAFLAGGTSKEKKAVLDALHGHQVDIVIGTHALLQEKVQFNRLGLVIIDEQHRFGVAQRLALLEKGEQSGVMPHQLIMTATPIPRTLAMTLYAELDNSIIDQRPPGRLPITTVAVSASRRSEVIERIRAVCHAKRQAYWVCVAIEDSAEQSLQSTKTMVQQLSEQLSGVRIGLIHGKLKAQEKQQMMQAFKAGELDLLVATTVIEVGVDVPNATLMIIENAERLGLAQLHQLRGRVGRGQQESYCVLLYTPPLDTIAHARLTALRESNDGFLLAEKDLQLRGPGEILGTRQSGQIQFKIVDLHAHAALIPFISKLAEQLVDEPTLWAELMPRWLSNAEITSFITA